MKNIKIILSSLVLISFSNLSLANAYFNSPSAGNTAYWDKCYLGTGGSGVVAEKFINSAAADINNIAKAQINDVQKPLLDADISSRDAQEKALDNFKTSIVNAIQDANFALNRSFSEVEMGNLEAELEYMKTTSQQVINEELYGFYSDTNGLNRPDDPSNVSVAEDPNSTPYQYFKSMCKRGKMISKVSSKKSSLKSAQSKNNEMTKKTNEVLNTTSSSQKAISKIESHYENYCSTFDIQNGLCENDDLELCEVDNLEEGVCVVSTGEKFKLENADINAANFVTPEYDFDSPEKANLAIVENFIPSYTYDEDQEEAAYDFADTIVYGSLIQAPSLSERNDPVKAKYVSRYNAYISSLNLAYNSLITSIEKRKPVTEDGAPVEMSELDVMRYTLQNLENSDNMASTFASKGKGVDISIYSVMTLNNKIELESKKQKERIKVLLSALVSNEANSSENIEYLESIK
jgi:hypothetical protein